MHYDHFEDKRKDKKRFLRLKIITNRDFNFITAVRPDSTVTDLANRALNAYLELSQQNRSKKQLTVSAVKQGRYFMPKSEIVSNLLTQDEEVEIIIVKAKPKFPEQHIPTHHDFEILTKKIKNFDESISKKPSTLSSQVNKLDKNKIAKNVQPINNSNKSSSDNSIDGSFLESKSSQLQHSKRERKKEKKQQKKLKHLQNSKQQKNIISNQKTKEKQAQKIQINEKQLQKMQNEIEPVQIKSPKITQLIPNKISQHKSLEKQATHQNQRGEQNLSLFNCKSVDRSVDKQNGSKISIKFPEPSKRDFMSTLRSQASEQKIDEMKKKHKPDHLGKHQNQEISRKGSVDNRSEKTPKINPVQSPKIVFHFETKHESPKVIYIPESKTISEMKQNIEKERQKMKTMSPLMLPKSSPKISLLQNPLEKILESTKSLQGSQNKKGKNQGSERKSSIQNQQQLHENKKEKDIPKIDRSPSPKIPNLPGALIDERKPIIMQPQIIEEQSSEQENIISFMKLPNDNIFTTNLQKAKIGSTDETRPIQQNESTIKKKSNASSKFFQIENLINKFKLEESDDENH